MKTKNKSNTITENIIHKLVSTRWELSFNLIPYMLQKERKMTMLWTVEWLEVNFEK